MWYDSDMTYLIEKRIVLGACYENYPKNFSVIQSLNLRVVLLGDAVAF